MGKKPRGLSRCASILTVSICFFGISARAQQAASEQAPLFSLLNLVKGGDPLVVKLGDTPVGIGEMPFGFFTGVVNWHPTVPISLQAKDCKGTQIPPPKDSKNSTTVPLFVVFDSIKLDPDGKPVRILEPLKPPPATGQDKNYLDLINLSSKETLEVASEGRKILLPKGERIRISKKSLSNTRILPEGPEISVSASEDGYPSRLLAIIYSLPDGGFNYAITSE